MLWGCAALLLLIPLAYRGSDSQWTYPLLVIPFAAYLIYAALLYVFLTPGFRRNYKYSGLAGVSFIAEFSAMEVTVRGPDVCWITQWKGFRHIKESKSVFMFYDGFMMYIFAKRYFSHEQLQTLQRLMTLSAAFKP